MTDAPVTIGMRPPHPGVFIREEVLEPLDLSVAQAADALRIEKAFGMSMDTLLKMQAWFDACAMRDRSDQIAVKRFVPKASAQS